MSVVGLRMKRSGRAWMRRREGMKTGSEILSTARTCLSLRLSVVPIRADGSKASSVFWEWLQYERMRLENVPKVFQPHSGLALICGKVSGNLEVLDFDNWEIYLSFLELARATGHGELVDRLRAGYEEQT